MASKAIDTVKPMTAHSNSKCSDLDDLNKRIAESAYFRAAERNFEGDHALQDWLDAECEINHLNVTSDSRPNMEL